MKEFSKDLEINILEKLEGISIKALRKNSIEPPEEYEGLSKKS
jgi:hypothetical protein